MRISGLGVWGVCTGLFRNIGADMLWMLLLGRAGSNTLHHRDKWVVVKVRVPLRVRFIRYIWDLKKGPYP